MKKDITDKNDVELLVNTFYTKVLQDEILAPKFQNIDMQKHLPTMYNFWNSLLLNEHSYTGNAFEKHIPLALTEQHFKQWLKLFEETVHLLFAGEKTELAIQRANSIAYIFQTKLKQNKN